MNKKLIKSLGIASTLMALLHVAPTQAADSQTGNAAVERGRYVAIVGGCNDCHTPGYLQSNGTTPEAVWLTGNSLGFQGPWGTTYPTNLRLVASRMSEDQWVKHLMQERRPPMPYFNVQKISEADKRALYQYIISLGATGAPAPAFAPPGQAVNTPYIDFAPKNIPMHASR